MRRSGTAFAALLACALAPAVARAAPIAAVTTTDLDGKPVVLPRRGARPTLVLLGFRHADKDVLAGWEQGLGVRAGQPDWVEMPVIGVGNGMVRGMIRGAMRSGCKDPAERANIAPIFGDAGKIAQGFGVAADAVAVMVVAPDGTVLARASGAFAAIAAAPLAAAWHGAHDTP